MGILMKANVAEGWGSVRVAKFYWLTYSRLGALIASMDAALPMAAGLVIEPSTIKAGPDMATQDGPASLTPTATGYEVALTGGDRALDLWSLLVDAREAGLIYSDWLVEVNGTGTLLTITDPSTEPEVFPDDEDRRRMEVDWVMRDSELPGRRP